MAEVSKRDHGWCFPLLPYTSSVAGTTSLGAGRLVPPGEEGAASTAARCCSHLLPRPSCLLCKSCLSKGIATEAHACKLELLKPG